MERAVIVDVGLATAQGGASDLRADTPLAPPTPVPWPLAEGAVSRVHHPARGLAPSLAGHARLAALARAALADLGSVPAGTPLLPASCNGGAAAWDADGWRTSFELRSALGGTPWEGQRLPVCSAACASGLHALALATRLIGAGTPEVVVLALDVLSAPSHQSFETLRVLASPSCQALPPWHRDGFVLGEAAVALRLRRAADAPEKPGLALALGHDLEGSDGLLRLLPALQMQVPGLVLGQGTGPAPVDEAERAAIASRVPPSVPVASALQHLGHTLGASGLLSVALAALVRDAPIAALGAARSAETLVVCRALGGACAVAAVGSGVVRRPAPRWHEPSSPPPLRDPVLREIAAQAFARRPRQAPDLLLIRLDAPLLPPASALLGGRLLPSSILEMTPGFVAQLVTRTWGFPGPAICLVGDEDCEPAIGELVRAAGDDVFRIDIRGKGEDRELVWNA